MSDLRRIAVVTATRAEYGLLMPVIKELKKLESDSFRVEIIVTGTHLRKEYGYTIEEIESDGFNIDHRIEISVNNSDPNDISENQAEALIKFTGLFYDRKYNAVMILGDRYEMLAIAMAAVNTRTAVFHLCGGDISEGAIDDCIRHSITKMSYLHFPTNEYSKRRIIQLGEEPERVFNYGSTSVDNIINYADMDKKSALESIGLGDVRYALCTYHPETIENSDEVTLMREVFDAIRNYPEICFVFTKSNADQGGSKINSILDEASRKIDNVRVYSSLGVRRYLSLMKYAEFVLGNSSSGIIEAPVLRVPTINIGDRQRGRLQAESIINCAYDSKSITDAISKAMSKEHLTVCKKVQSPYGSGNAGERIAQKAYETVMGGKIDLKKKFYDLGMVAT